MSAISVPSEGKMDARNRVILDKAERNWLAQIKQTEPEYQELELDQVLYVEL